jgi:hypothetical protein
MINLSHMHSAQNAHDRRMPAVYPDEHPCPHPDCDELTLNRDWLARASSCDYCAGVVCIDCDAPISDVGLCACDD